MKKLILLGLTIVLFTACKNQPERWTKTSPEIDVTKALVKDYQDANWEQWITHYADTAEVYHNTAEPITPKQLEEGFKNENAKLSSYRFSDKDIYYEMIIDDEGDKWVYFWGTWEGKIADSDKELMVPVHLALKFVDLKIVEEYGYYDNSVTMAAMNEVEAENMKMMMDPEMMMEPEMGVQ